MVILNIFRWHHPPDTAYQRHLGPTDLGGGCAGKMMESCRANDKMDGENDFDLPNGNGNLDDVSATEITCIKSS